MPELSPGLLGCYRCGYVWRPTGRTGVRICARCKSRLWDVPKLHPIRRGNALGIEEVLRPKRAKILEVIQRHKGRSVRVFGSVARKEATSNSDVDLLVEFADGASILDRAGLILDLEDLLHRKVDVVAEPGLHWFARPQVLFEAVPL